MLPATRTTPIRVLVVDDSAVMRRLLGTMLASDPEIAVVGTAADPLIAEAKLAELRPDVLTLDVEMPNMSGLDFLDRLMAERPTPVIMVSSLTHRGAEATLTALERGAFDFIPKPSQIGSDRDGAVRRFQDELVAKVKAAASFRVRPRKPAPVPAEAPEPHPALLHPKSAPHPAPAAPVAHAGEFVVAIGASTGGVEAIRSVLVALPAEVPPIVITQHMPEMFTASFAARLNRECAASVSEAREGERLQPGHVYIAAGNHHLEVTRGTGSELHCHVHDGPAVSGHRPSVDVLFGSVARALGGAALGVILTGMGRDGAQGLAEMRKAGAHTIGQDEPSCVVYGMPKAARALGAVETELPLARIAPRILGAMKGLAAAPAA